MVETTGRVHGTPLYISWNFLWVHNYFKLKTLNQERRLEFFIVLSFTHFFSVNYCQAIFSLLSYEFKSFQNSQIPKSVSQLRLLSWVPDPRIQVDISIWYFKSTSNPVSQKCNLSPSSNTSFFSSVPYFGKLYHQSPNQKSGWHSLLFPTFIPLIQLITTSVSLLPLEPFYFISSSLPSL